MNASWALSAPVATATAVVPRLLHAHVLGERRAGAERGSTVADLQVVDHVPSGPSVTTWVTPIVCAGEALQLGAVAPPRR